MYCPQCGVEYRAGFSECADCRVPLVPALAPEIPDSHPEPVMVFESTDRFAINLAKGALEDSGIPFSFQGAETDTHLLGSSLFPSCRFLVPKDREPEARELLASLESPIEDEGGE